jgi:hypothetical protein
MPSPFQRHFTFKHPLFKRQQSRSGIWWENSAYYFWWEFLRRHDDYKKTCDNGGKGKYAALYADFGNVQGMSFKDWWTKGGRGARLFSEPPLPNSIVVLNPFDVDALSDSWKAGSVLVIAIPVALRKRFILRKFSALLKRHHTRRRGQRTFRESRALYPIAAQFNRNSLKKILDTYDLHQSQPDLTLWEIAQKLGLGTKLTGKDTPAEMVHKKSVLSVAASKKLALAHRIIDGVGRGVFPAISTRDRNG